MDAEYKASSIQAALLALDDFFIMSHRLGLKVVRSACSVGLFVVALASLLGFFSDASDQALPSSQSRRLRSHRHARDEIDWPEGNKRHAHSASETAEQSSARQELHRFEFVNKDDYRNYRLQTSRQASLFL